MYELLSCRRHMTADEKARAVIDRAAWDEESRQVRHRDPACWSWPVPDDPHAPSTERVEFFNRCGYDPRMGDHEALTEWQDGRCGICGGRDADKLDHDHYSGWARGWLCHSCNLSEGHASDPEDRFARWRARPAAAILGVVIEYHGMYWDPERHLSRQPSVSYLPDWAPPDRRPPHPKTVLGLPEYAAEQPPLS